MRTTSRGPRRSSMTLSLALGLAALAAPVLRPPGVRGGEPPERLGVILLSGANNHDWARTTPVLRRILEECDRFTVLAVLEDPARLVPEMLGPCRVIVSNWSAFPALTGRQWGKAAEDAFVSWMRKGGGFVIVHAASATSQDWPEFQALAGLTWAMGTTGHGTYHTFRVSMVDAVHPVARGLEDFWIRDELWHAMASLSGEEPKVLARAFSAPEQAGTGKEEPVLVTTSLGEGRGVNLVLGHDEASMENVGFRTLLLRAAEWAATGEVTIAKPEVWPGSARAAEVPWLEPDAVLRGALAYRHGGSRRDLALLEALVRYVLAADAEAPSGRTRRLAARLAGCLDSKDASVEAKAFILEQLSAIGGEPEVSAIAGRLREADLAPAALLALSRIPAPEAEAALRAHLAFAEGDLRLGAVAALGSRRARAAVPDLVALLADPDAAVATAAASALGMIGGEAAARALDDALDSSGITSRAGVRSGIAEALLACADGFRADGEDQQAAAIFERLSGPGETPGVRAGAMRGILLCAGRSDPLVEAILGEDEDLREAAISVAAERAAGPGILAALRGRLAAGPDRAAALAALGSWPGPEPLPDLLSAARASPEMRAAALESVARLASLPSPRPEEAAAVVAGALDLATTTEERQALLLALGAQACPSALRLAVEMLDDLDAACAAGRAAVAIARSLPRDDAETIAAALRSVVRACSEPEVVQGATGLLREVLRPVNLALGAKASSPDGLEPDGASGPDQAAIDGNLDTYWDEADDQPLYRLRLEFPGPTEVASIRVVGHAYRSHTPRDFDIILDGNVVKEVRGAEFDPQRNDHGVDFPRTTCTTLELAITGTWPRSPGIRELEVYGASVADVAGAPGIEWRRADDSLALLREGHIIWKLSFARGGAKPFLDPVALPDGTPLTWLSPPDHPWHRSLWFAWKELNGVNYWEEDAATGLSAGLSDVTGATVETSPDGSAKVALAITYHVPGGPPVLTEARELSFGAPDGTGRWRIDWASTFTAGDADVLLRGGTAGGGYAGLSVRIAKETRDWKLIDAEGREDIGDGGLARNCHGQKARWMDLSFVPASRGKPAGIAILDHPDNLRAPSPWHAVLDEKASFGYFSPAPLWSEPHTLPAGKSFALRYRILVHPGAGDALQLEREWRRFRAPRRAR